MLDRIGDIHDIEPFSILLKHSDTKKSQRVDQVQVVGCFHCSSIRKFRYIAKQIAAREAAKKVVILFPSSPCAKIYNAHIHENAQSSRELNRLHRGAGFSRFSFDKFLISRLLYLLIESTVLFDFVAENNAEDWDVQTLITYRERIIMSVSSDGEPQSSLCTRYRGLRH